MSRRWRETGADVQLDSPIPRAFMACLSWLVRNLVEVLIQTVPTIRESPGTELQAVPGDCSDLPNYWSESVQEQTPWPVPSSTKTVQSSAKSADSDEPYVESSSSSSVREYVVVPLCT
jgi:hypothetical protein